MVFTVRSTDSGLKELREEANPYEEFSNCDRVRKDNSTFPPACVCSLFSRRLEYFWRVDPGALCQHRKGAEELFRDRVFRLLKDKGLLSNERTQLLLSLRLLNQVPERSKVLATLRSGGEEERGNLSPAFASATNVNYGGQFSRRDIKPAVVSVFRVNYGGQISRLRQCGGLPSLNAIEVATADNFRGKAAKIGGGGGNRTRVRRPSPVASTRLSGSDFFAPVG